MKNYDLEINDDNLKRSIETDILNRNKKLNKFIEFLNVISGNKIISVDGKWGCGKTFFLKQLEYLNKSEFVSNKKFNEENIKLFKEKYDVYYYNAWENDSHSSPLLSLIYNLINDFPKEKVRTASGNVELPFDIVDSLKTISKNFVNFNKIKTYNDLTNEIHTSEEKKNALNNLINNILPNDKKLIFIVDELDRCKPSYAVNMIEVIKHFYSNEKIIFLLGTNNLQLSYVISNYYGTNFDGYGYLNKIFNLVIELGDIPTSDYLDLIVQNMDSSNWEGICLYGVCDYFNFSMREINRLLNDFDILNHYLNTSYGGMINEDLIVKYLFLPYCLGLKIINMSELQNFLSGKGYEMLKKYIFTNNEIIKILKYCYNSAKGNNDQISEEKLLNEMDIYLEEKYNKYFLYKVTDWNIEHNKSVFLDVFSLLSDYSNLN